MWHDHTGYTRRPSSPIFIVVLDLKDVLIIDMLLEVGQERLDDIRQNVGAFVLILLLQLPCPAVGLLFSVQGNHCQCLKSQSFIQI